MFRLAYSYVRNNLRSVIDEVHTTNEPALVLSTGNKPVVIIKESQYDYMLKAIKGAKNKDEQSKL